MTETLEKQSWNNIPIPTREMFELLTDALIGQDIHTWERKSLINERFFKMQHLASRLNDKIKENKQQQTRWVEDIVKKTQEMHRRLDIDLQDKYAELSKRIE